MFVRQGESMFKYPPTASVNGNGIDWSWISNFQSNAASTGPFVKYETKYYLNTESNTTTWLKDDTRCFWEIADVYKRYFADTVFAKAWCYEYVPKPLSARLKEVISKRMAPAIILNDRRRSLSLAKDVREERARETLRRVVGDQRFRKYLKYGFLDIKAKSGLVYQIFAGHGITCVFDKGKLVDRLCVVLRGEYPPTDSLIMRYLLILNNETQFRSLAIKHGLSIKETEFREPDEVLSLAEALKKTKQNTTLQYRFTA